MIDQTAGPPLDVVTPLRAAREHARKAVLAWLVAAGLGVAGVFGVAARLGWPEVRYSVSGQVVSREAAEDNVRVTFVGRGGGRSVAWDRSSEDSGWEVGEAIRAFVGTDGDIHHDRQFDFAGVPLIFYGSVIALFAIFAVRRWWGLWIAWRDLHRRGDPPHFGYVALIHDPTPKMWRPLLAVWHEDPMAGAVSPQDPMLGKDLPKPQAVYRADEETSKHIETIGSVQVLHAWIDTGRFRFQKPRWVGTESGVLIPHRRALFGRSYFRLTTRKWNVEGPFFLEHGPPDPSFVPAATDATAHRLAPMVLWRAIFVLALIPVTGWVIRGEGDPFATFSPPPSVGFDWSRLQRDVGPAETIDLGPSLGRLGDRYGLVEAQRVGWVEGPDHVVIERWAFASVDDARAMAEAELGRWELHGRRERGEIVAELADGGVGSLRVMSDGKHVVKVLVWATDEPDVELLREVVNELNMASSDEG